jgi:hypothetical protein
MVLLLMVPLMMMLLPMVLLMLMLLLMVLLLEPAQSARARTEAQMAWAWTGAQRAWVRQRSTVCNSLETGKRLPGDCLHNLTAGLSS